MNTYDKLSRLSGKIAGASNISMIMPGKFDFSKVKKEYYKRVKEDRREYGEDPYNGSWSTLPEVKANFGDIKENEHEAEEYCLKRSEKWSYAYAVKFYIDGEKLEALKEKVKAINDKHWKVRTRMVKKYNIQVPFTPKRILEAIGDNEKDKKLFFNSYERDNKAQERYEKAKTKAKTNWMIAGWAAS